MIARVVLKAPLLARGGLYALMWARQQKEAALAANRPRRTAAADRVLRTEYGMLRVLSRNLSTANPFADAAAMLWPGKHERPMSIGES